ncbi:Hypothetical protein Ccan_21570 [Capnocytophaga canimorsus Cc5]|uniref:Uncharacterized protein n=1 Tax=Capnocytophaga canimorsus (strain 5) TaxID=860228 RepID=F9YUN6_CAPCC|nr:Hypothetical protein Ccan_21570 [Capnocytophaga canimorsus Cc5]
MLKNQSLRYLFLRKSSFYRVKIESRAGKYVNKKQKSVGKLAQIFYCESVFYL